MAEKRGTLIRRETEEAESLPLPPRALPPKQSEEPEWRQELAEKLAGYRERGGQRELFDDDEDETAEISPSPPPAARRPAAKLPPIREARTQDLPPPRAAATQRSILPPPPAAPDWKTQARRVDASTAINPPVADQRPAEERKREPEAPRRTRDRAAPISLRVVASLMDVAVVMLALGLFAGVCIWVSEDILAGVDGLRLIAVAFVMLMAFYWIFYLRFLGRTAGMTWLGLRVLNFDGDLPDDSQRRARAFGTVLSAAALGIGFAWAAADEGRLTWHDRISKTFVAMDR